MELKETIEAIGRAFETFKAENDARIKAIEGRGSADPLLVEKIEKINADISAMSDLKRQLEALENAVARSEFPGGGNSEFDKLKAKHRAAFEKWFRKGEDPQAVKDLAIQANLSTLSDPDGGALVLPPEMQATIDRVAGTVSAMRRLATVMTIGTDTYEKLVNQGGAESGWVGEKAARDETDTPTVKKIAINAKEVYAKPSATQTLLDDSRVDIAAWLGSEIEIAFAEKEGLAFISGNGVEQPKGIGAYTMIADSSYAWGKIGFITSGNANLLSSPDRLMDVTLAVKSIYLNGSAWLMNRTTQGKIRQLKNTEGDYIWRPGLELGAPNTLFGYPVETDDNMDTIAAGKFPVWFGNWKRGYMVIDRYGIRVLRNPYVDPPNVQFYTTKRVGGGIVMYEAIKALKIAA